MNGTFPQTVWQLPIPRKEFPCISMGNQKSSVPLKYNKNPYMLIWASRLVYPGDSDLGQSQYNNQHHMAPFMSIAGTVHYTYG